MFSLIKLVENAEQSCQKSDPWLSGCRRPYLNAQQVKKKKSTVVSYRKGLSRVKREMAQRLRVIAALTEDKGSNPIFHL